MKSKILSRVLSCVLTFVMVLGTCSTAFAAGGGGGGGGGMVAPILPSPVDTINYVSLGDSMTNGYGLEGYNGNNGVEDYGYSYANLFAQWLDDGFAGTVDHKQLAMSGCRAEDYHWLLEFDHENEELRDFVNYISSGWSWNEDEWYSVFDIGDYRTWDDLCRDNNRSAAAASNILGYKDYDSPYATDGQKDAAQWLDGYHADGNYVHYTNDNQVAIFAEYAQSAIEDADIISMSIGNSNFGTFMFDQIVNAVGYNGGTPAGAMRFKIDRALTECPEAVKDKALELIDELYARVEEYLGIELDYEEADAPEDYMTAAIANAAVYAGVSYVLNYAGTVDAILRLNPDADIIMVGLMNTYLSANQEITEPTIGSLLEIVFPPLNAFIAALPTVMKGVGNDVYKDATFYYAEAPEVACMVEVYGTDFYNDDTTSNRGSITRQRFFRDLMRPIEQLFGASDRFGAPLDYSLTFNELCDYDDMTDTEKAAYAYEYKSKALTCAIYLAFEKATIIAGKEAPVTLESVMGLGSATDSSQFDGVITHFYENIATYSQDYNDDALTAVSFILIDNGVPLSQDAVIACLSADDINAAIATTVAAMMQTQIDALTALHSGGLQEILSCENVAHMSYCGAFNTTFNGYIAQLTPYIMLGKENIPTLCQLLALPDALGDAVAEDDNSTSWFGLLSRCVIGDGLGGHPSQAGHDALFEAVKTAYDEQYTAKDETIKNVTAIINEYYDEAYAYAYAKADEKGYVDAAADAIDNAIAVITSLDLSNVEMTDEFRAKLEAEIAQVVATLIEIKGILAEDKASDVAGLVQSVKGLWDDLNKHLTNAGAILDQAEFDIKTLVVPVVDAYVSALVESFKDTAKTEIAKAAHKHYEADDDSYYVAIGGDTVAGTGIGRDDKTYFDLIAENYEIDNIDFGEKALLPSEVVSYIGENRAEIAKADLITYQMDASSIIYATLSDTPDWDKYLDAETKAFVNEVLEQTETILTTNWTEYANAKLGEVIPQVKAAILENLPEEIPFAEDILDTVVEFAVPYIQKSISDAISGIDNKRGEIASKIEAIDEMVWDSAEKLAYAVVSYVAESKKAIEEIQAINPDATLVVLGMYNPFNGLQIVVGENKINVGEIFEYVVNAGNIYHTALAIENGGFAFVDISAAQTNGFAGEIDATNMEITDIAGILLAASDSMHANAAGHEYIADQILKAFVCDYSVYEELDKTYHTVKCSLCGDAKKEKHTFSGKTCTLCGYVKTSGGVSGGGTASKPAKEPEATTTSKVDKFTDISKDTWYYDYVKAIVEKGLMNGVAETQFAPNATLTRGMFVTILHRVEGELAVEGGVDFTDVAADQYYANAVKWANANGIVKGITETEFAPNAEVTREQMAAMIARYVDYKKIAVAAEGDVTYTDSAEISEYAKDAVITANKLGVLIGNADGSFAPKKNATRAEAAALFVRLLGVLAK